MKIINAEGLGETAYKTRLDNGLTVFLIKKPGFKKITAMLGVGYGSVDHAFELDGKRHETPPGVAHFLEHKLFDMPDGRNVLQLYSQMGASPNAFTSNSATAYHFECSSCFEAAFELLLECVFTPHFTLQSVEKERGIISQEISMYRDMPAARLRDELMPMLYSRHPVRVPIIGTQESILEISHETLYNCYNAFYRPSNMVLTIAGDIEPEDLFETAARLSPSNTATAPLFVCDEPFDVVEREKVISMDVPQPMFAIGVKLPPPQHALELEIRCELAVGVLVGASSPLYNELYNSGLIDSSFNARPFLFKNGGTLLFMGRSRDPIAVRDALLREAVRLLRADIDPKLFERVKRAEWGDRVRVLDSPMEIARSVALDYLSGDDFFSLPRVFNSVDTQSLMDIYSQMNKMSIVQCRRS